MEAMGAEALAMRPTAAWIAARTVWAPACPLLPASFLEKNSVWVQLFFFSVSANINTNSSILTRGVAMGMAEWRLHSGRDLRPPVTCRPPCEESPA